MIVHGSQESKDFDRAAQCQYDITTLHLMEVAGKVCADVIDSDFQGSAKKAIIVCGPGNNGGDGFVIARFLLCYGWNIQVILFQPIDSYSNASLENLRILFKMEKDLELGLAITHVYTEETFWILFDQLKPDVLIDALFGVGLSRSIDGIYNKAIQWMNQTDKPIYAIDIPSGISADTGKMLPLAIKAKITITFESPKAGHLLYPGKEHTGKLIIKKIGFPNRLLRNSSKMNTFLEPKEAKIILKERKMDSHKKEYGKAYLFGGSATYQGAFHLALSSCLRTGAGLVYAVYKKSLSQLLVNIPSEVIHEPVGTNQIGEYDDQSLLPFQNNFYSKAPVLGMGPGLGRDTDVMEIIRKIYLSWNEKLVIDADGLFAIKEIVGKNHPSDLILTPHIGEMAYLTKMDVETIKNDLISTAKSFAKEWNCIIVLKSASTIVVSPEGYVFINNFGNPGMAKGGSGDVLTGIITSLLAQGYSAWNASVLGVTLHSLAGDMAEKKQGDYSVLPSDICESIPEAYRLVRE